MQQSRFKGTSNRINLVKHFFVCKASNESKGSYEAKIVDKYCSQLHEFEEEMASQKEMSKMSLNAESTVETFLNKIMLTVEEDMQMR